MCFFIEIELYMDEKEKKFLKMIRMEKSNLSSIENGRQNVTSLTLLKISKAIGVEVSSFFQE